MELFSVKRYTDIKCDANSNENVIKDKLLRKIEQRKRKHKQTSTENGEDKEPLKEEKQKVATETTEETSEEQNSINEEPITKEEPDEYNKVDIPFEVLGEDVKKRKVESAQLYQPAWIAHPTMISTVMNELSDTVSVKSCQILEPHIRKSLKEMKIKKLFPVQTAVIPWILEAHSKPKPFRPRDICVSAPTGSGKTLAFAIPIVQLLAKSVEKKIRALVVLPVAELAHQVFKVFQKLCQRTKLSVCLLSKKVPFAVEQNKLVGLHKGKPYSSVDIVVTTPGRLVEHLFETKNLSFNSLKFLVIDEADRIMDAFFQNWLFHLDDRVRDTSKKLFSGNSGPLCYNELLASASTVPHKLLFSATMSDDPEKLQDMRLFQPKLFTSVKTSTVLATDTIPEEIKENKNEIIGQFTTPAELSEKYCITETRLKPLTLFALIQENNWRKFLCFTNSIDSASRLAFVLEYLFKESGMTVKELSASLIPSVRSKVLSQFARGKINGIVCSDALARGIDVPDVDVVISYDPPRHIKTYVHRVGRTARAGRAGTAIVLVTEKEQEMVNKILLDAGKVINDEIKVSDSCETKHATLYSMALEALRTKVETDKKKVVIQKRLGLMKARLHNTDQLSLMDKLKLQALDGKEKITESEVKVAKRFRSKKLNKMAKKILKQEESKET